ncbi:hypothetical protein MHYP_G00098130 [Metynnis hypsauchen]
MRIVAGIISRRLFPTKCPAYGMKLWFLHPDSILKSVYASVIRAEPLPCRYSIHLDVGQKLLACVQDPVQFSLHSEAVQQALVPLFLLCQMSLGELLKMLGLGAVALTLGVEWLDWLARRLWLRRGPQGPLKEVLFFPSPITCVEHLYSPSRPLPCSCPLPHGMNTSFTRLLVHLLSACVSLDLCVFSFSHMELSRAVLLLHSRGVAVRVLTDRDYMSISGSQIGTLRRAGIYVRHELSKVVHMHHKFVLVDGRKLITGSLNWTATAVQSNKENVIVTEEPELVRPFQDEFHRLWEASDPSNHAHQTPFATATKGLIVLVSLAVLSIWFIFAVVCLSLAFDCSTLEALQPRLGAKRAKKMASVSEPRQQTQAQKDAADQNFDYMFKLLIIGNSSVGKTSFLFRYADDSFTSAFVSTVGIDFKVKTVYRNEKRVKLQIWDTAGQERYRTITTAYYRGAMGFLLMYDITNQESFYAVQDWATQIKTYSWDNAQVILVGNKCDLEDDRLVATEDGQRLANELGFQFFEASAKDNINVKQVFERLVDVICDKMNESMDGEPSQLANHKGPSLQDTPPAGQSGCSC